MRLILDGLQVCLHAMLAVRHYPRPTSTAIDRRLKGENRKGIPAAIGSGAVQKN